MNDFQEQNILSGIRDAQEAVRHNESEVARRVAAAREHGISWQSIGTVLGVSKQAAWERYGKNDPHPGRNKPPEQD